MNGIAALVKIAAHIHQIKPDQALQSLDYIAFLKLANFDKMSQISPRRCNEGHGEESAPRHLVEPLPCLKIEVGIEMDVGLSDNEP
jgi:hypothetical protein